LHKAAHGKRHASTPHITTLVTQLAPLCELLELLIGPFMDGELAGLLFSRAVLGVHPLHYGSRLHAVQGQEQVAEIQEAVAVAVKLRLNCRRGERAVELRHV